MTKISLNAPSFSKSCMKIGLYKYGYVINGLEYKVEYYLLDEFYLNWETFVKTTPFP